MPGTVRAIVATAEKHRQRPADPGDLPLLQFRLTQYLDIIIQSVTIAICAGLAVLIDACLGPVRPVGLHHRAADQGDRGAQGDGRRHPAGGCCVLLWQFTIRCCWSPSPSRSQVGFFAMDWWLHGFAYRVSLSPLTFVLAAGGGGGDRLGDGVLPVVRPVARAKPAGALRYE